MIINLPTTKAHLIYTLTILENGRVVRRIKPKRNLIMDGGLDQIGAGTGWPAVTGYCRIGTGTTPTKRASGSTTISRSGATVTASASFFVAGDTNRVLKFDSGDECRLTYVSATVATSDISGTVASSPGTVWDVIQTSLTTPVKEKARDSGIGSPTITWDGVLGQLRYRSIYTFSIESGAVNYTEVSWSSGASGAGFFSRDLFAGSGIALTNNQQLVVTSDLYLTLSPVLATAAVGSVITGWASSTGNAKVEDIFSFIYNAWANDGWHKGFIMNGTPGANALRTTAGNLSAVNSWPSGTSVGTNTILSDSTAAAAYVNKSFYFDVTCTWNGAAAGVSLTAVKSVGFCMSGGGYNVCVFRVLLDNTYNKDPYYRLILTFRFTWGRVLVN